MKIDLHIHSRERSPCGRVDEETQIRTCIDAGLDAMAFTDHNRLVPADRLAELRAKYAPFQIFTGIEIDCDGEHILAIGVHDPRLEVIGWRYPELVEYVRARGGLVILAHPYRYRPEIAVDIEALPPDGIEYHSYNTPANRRDEILAMAQRLGMVPFSNSDSHFAGTIGNYFTLTPNHAQSDAELVAEILEMKKKG